MKQPAIAIVGATGLVGRMFLQTMEEADCPVGELRLFASPKSAGTTLSFRDVDYDVTTIEPGCFEGIDYALFSAGSTVSTLVAPQAVAEGATVIDNSSAWRMDPVVPLVVPEININDAYDQRLIANPNCSTIQSVLPLHVLETHYGVTQVEYNTYQAVSGSGQRGLEDLRRTREGHAPLLYPHPIAHTAIPHIDDFMDDGYTKEEHKMMNETRKILHRSDLNISATCVRIPVEHSHGVSIRVALRQPFELEHIRSLFRQHPGIELIDDPAHNEYPTSLLATGSNQVFVGRIRQDTIDANTLLLYVVADNIRKGAAWNAVQIMMELMNHA